MTKDEFYLGKRVVRVEWWLHECDLPVLTWGRLRVFDNGSADNLWAEGGRLNGFDDYNSAATHLAEDENIRFGEWDAEEEQGYGVRQAEIVPPTWVDHPDQPFRFFGSY